MILQNCVKESLRNHFTLGKCSSELLQNKSATQGISAKARPKNLPLPADRQKDGKIKLPLKHSNTKLKCTPTPDY